MAEGGRRGAQRLEQLDLRRGVGHMVLAADDMGDAEVDVVDHARQRVEIGAVVPDQHRVRQRGGIDMLPPAHEIVPDDVALLEQEAPMGLAPLGFELCPLLAPSTSRRRGHRPAGLPRASWRLRFSSSSSGVS